MGFHVFYPIDIFPCRWSAHSRHISSKLCPTRCFPGQLLLLLDLWQRVVPGLFSTDCSLTVCTSQHTEKDISSHILHTKTCPVVKSVEQDPAKATYCWLTFLLAASDGVESATHSHVLSSQLSGVYQRCTD